MAAGSSIRRLLFFCEIFCSRGGYCRTLQTAFYDVSRVVQCCRTLQTAFYAVSRVAQCCSTSHTAFYDVSRVVQTSGTVHFHFPRVGELAFPFPARWRACISISRASGTVHFHFPRVRQRAFPFPARSAACISISRAVASDNCGRLLANCGRVRELAPAGEVAGAMRTFTIAANYFLSYITHVLKYFLRLSATSSTDPVGPL